MALSYIIPLKPIPQRISIRLGDNDYHIQTKWNKYLPAWVMDLSDVDNTLIAGGIALVTGVDLIAHLAYLDLNMQLFVRDSSGDAVPGHGDLGATSFLYYVPVV
jgi:uncharacterized protein DUF6983